MTLHARIDQLMRALEKGLSAYAGPVRIALLTDHVYDPYGLLRPHAELLQSGQRTIAGLVGHAAPGQFWYAEQPPGVSSPESLAIWLEAAAACLSDLLAVGPERDLEAARIALENFAPYALERFIRALYRHFGQRSPGHSVLEILETLAAMSLATEEAIPTSGEILFAERLTDQPLQLCFSPRPSMQDKKHLSKLFHGLWKGVSLISCGREIWGIARREELRLDLLLRADFHGGIGALYLGGQLCPEDIELCTITGGRFQTRRLRPELPGLTEALFRCGFTSAETRGLECDLSILCSEIARLQHGATLVLETGTEGLQLSGQSVAPTRLDIQALRALSTVDGAIHLDREGRLKGFACLLDGMASAREDRARGARYNSALRFTETHPDCVVVVISADGPISVIRDGLRLGDSPAFQRPAEPLLTPPTLEEWLQA